MIETFQRQNWTANVFSISDMFTNEIISYDLSLNPLNKAYEKLPIFNGLIIHPQQGWQYQFILKEHESMSCNGNFYDNSIMEMIFGRLKNEIYYGYENSY